MPQRSFTVRSKLALVFLTACALTFFVGGSLISRSVSNTLENEILLRIDFQSRAYATALDRQLSMLARRAEDFASDGFVLDCVESLATQGTNGPGTDGEQGPLRASLRGHLIENKLSLVPAFLDLHLLGSDSAPLLSAHGAPGDGLLSWLQPQAHSKAVLSSPLLPPAAPSRVTRVALAAPLLGRETGAPLGWLVAEVNASAWVFGALAPASGSTQEELPTNGRIHLVDDQGARLSLLRELFREGWPTERSAHAQSGFGMTFQSNLVGGEPSTRRLAGEGMLLRSFPLAMGGLELQVETSTEEALEAVAGLQGRIYGIGLLVAAATCLLFLLPMGILTRPLLQLAEAARRVGDGQAAPEVALDSKDEIGEVSRAFQAMAVSIEERTRLQERTAEDLRHHEAQLKSERDRLKAVIGSMRGGLIVLDPDGHPVVSNQAAEPVLRAIQSDPSGISSHHICERITGKGDACHACLFDPTRAPRSCQVEVGERTFEVHASQLPADVDGRHGRVLVCLDFSNRIQQDERMIHQERLAVLGEVAAVMAHELNNPLAAISLYNQMLASELEGQPGPQENVAVIQRNVESCKRTVRELLDYATGATPEVDTIDLGAVLEDVVAFTRPLQKRAEVRVELELGDAPLLAWGDELQIRQVFVNLLMNALQALGPQGGRVTIQAYALDNHLNVTIADDGPGIPSSAQADIFRPFFTTKERGEGTGLGLPTARRIAEMHGGGLELVKTDQEGSVFLVRLLQQEVSTV